MVDALQRGRVHFEERQWGAARADLTVADSCTPLDVADLERLAVASYLTGNDAESTAAWSRAYRGHLTRGDPRSAARSAFWSAFGLMVRGEYAQASGWLGRAQRHLDGIDEDCPERGLVLLPGAIQQFEEGDIPGAFAAFTEIGSIGVRHGNADLLPRAISAVGTP